MADELRRPSSVIRFNPLNGQLERPTLLLKTKSGELLGELQYENLNLSFVGKGLNEISFDVHKSVNGKDCPFWERIRDLCTIDFVDFGQFEASVSMNDENETIKSVTCESLETELGQRILYEFHVNDDEAITLTEGKFTPTVLYNEKDTEHSLLHRALKEKAPHWSVGDVSLLFNINGRVYNRESIQRTFTIDGTAIYDLFENEVSQECCCVFTYDTYDRKVNCYNLEECVYDGRTMDVLDNFYSIDGVEFYEIVYNEDGSRNDRQLTDTEISEKHLKYLNGIGEDTSIFVSKNKLSRSFTIDSDKGSIKNCFRVTGGDDIITNRVAAANLSGNNYIYIFGNFQYEDMSDELVEKIKSYMKDLEDKEKEFTADGGVYILDETCTYKDGVCYDENNFVLPTAETDGTNVFVLDPLAYYKDGNAYDKDDNVLLTNQYIYKDTTGLYTKYCQLLDRIAYVEHSKFPNTEHETNATKEKQIILDYFSSNNVVSKTRWSVDSYAHVVGNIEDMISVVCDNRYKIKMLSGEDYPDSCTYVKVDNNNANGVWKGYIRITREVDELDTEEFELTVNIRLAYDEGDLELCRQKIEIAIASMDIVNLDFSSFETLGKGTIVTEEGVKEVDIYTDLADLLRKYNYTSVSSFVECFSSCRDTLDDLYSNLGIEESGIPESDAMLISRKRYTIRYNTANVVAQEINTKLANLKAELESIDKQIKEFRASLDMQTYFGTDLWEEFQCYIREDEYNNGNYISDGLSDSEIMLKCKELLDVAREELSKACNIQYQISGDLNNIFAITDLKKLHDKFAIFNYVRSQVDDKIYKLRLMQIDFSDSSPESLSVTFSEQIERVDGKTSDIKGILESAQSISTSYSSTVKQSKQGATALNTFSTMQEEGFNSSLYTVKNNRTTTSFDDTGIHCKSVLDSGIFSDCMLNVNSNGVYMTNNGWESVDAAIGKFKFNDQWVYGVNAKLIMGDLIVGDELNITGNITVGKDLKIGGVIQSENYNKEEKTGSMLNLEYGTFDFAGGNLTYSDNKLKVNGEIHAKSGTFDGDIVSKATITGGRIEGSELIGSTLIVETEDDTETPITISYKDSEYENKSYIAPYGFCSQYYSTSQGCNYLTTYGADNMNITASSTDGSFSQHSIDITANKYICQISMFSGIENETITLDALLGIISANDITTKSGISLSGLSTRLTNEITNLKKWVQDNFAPLTYG